MLDKISTEILEEIIRQASLNHFQLGTQLRCREDLASLCQVSRRIREIARPILYQSIDVSVNEYELDHGNWYRDFNSSQWGKEELGFTRNLVYESEFHASWTYRCFDYYDAVVDDTEIEEPSLNMKGITTELEPLIKHFKDNYLRSFM